MWPVQFSSVQSLSRVWLLRPHESQHARPPCPSPTPRACSNSCPSSQWSHPNISSSVVPFSSCLQSLSASGSFLKSQFFISGGQIIGASDSASVLPNNIQDWFPLGRTGWISLKSKGLSRISPIPQFKSNNFLALSFLYGSTLSFILRAYGPTPMHTQKSICMLIYHLGDSLILKWQVLYYDHHPSANTGTEPSFLWCLSVLHTLFLSPGSSP